MNNSLPLSGQVAAVTGAASGIGLASAQAMADAGATVVLVDRDLKALDKACATLGAKALPLVLAVDDVKVCVGKHSPLVARMPDIDEAIRAMRRDGSITRLRKP